MDSFKVQNFIYGFLNAPISHFFSFFLFHRGVICALLNFLGLCLLMKKIKKNLIDQFGAERSRKVFLIRLMKIKKKLLRKFHFFRISRSRKNKKKNYLERSEFFLFKRSNLLMKKIKKNLIDQFGAQRIFSLKKKPASRSEAAEQPAS